MISLLIVDGVLSQFEKKQNFNIFLISFESSIDSLLGSKKYIFLSILEIIMVEEG